MLLSTVRITHVDNKVLAKAAEFALLHGENFNVQGMNNTE